jgi:formylglycine-generating enzyme required for sulfatase activity
VAVNDQDFADGRTPEGVWHLIGNVWEWTSTYATDTTCPDPYAEDCRIWDGKSTQVQALHQVGLGWSVDLLSEEMGRVSEFISASPVSPDDATGFRCADSQP